MNILQIILMYLVYIIIFSVIYIFTWGLVRNYFRSFINYYQVFLGIVLAILVVIAENLIPSFVPVVTTKIINIFLPLLICWLIGIFVSWYSTIFYIMLIFVYSFAIAPVIKLNTLQITNINEILEMTLLFIMLFFVALCGSTFKWQKLTTWSLLALLSFIITNIFMFVEVSNNNWHYYLQIEWSILIWLVVSYLLCGICLIIETIYSHAIKLQNIISFDRQTYLREAFVNDYIYNYCHQNNIRYGVYFTYVISGVQNLDTYLPESTIKEKIINSISQQVFNLLEKREVIFFKASLNQFGIFLPLKINKKNINLNQCLAGNNLSSRNDQDNLKFFEQLLQQVKTTFIYNNLQIKIKLQGYASFYGLNSNNLEKLKENNLLASEIWLRDLSSHHNIVVYADSKEIMKFKLTWQNIMSLNERYDLEKINTSYFSVINLANDYVIIAYYCINFIDNSYISHIVGWNNKLYLPTRMDVIFNRFLAALNIKNFYKAKTPATPKKIFINYLAKHLASEEFNLKKFLSKINDLNLKPKMIILTFDLLEQGSNYNILFERITELKKLGFQIAVKNIGEQVYDPNLLAYYIADYALLSQSLITKVAFSPSIQELITNLIKLLQKLDIILIAGEINSYLSYKILKQLGINYMYGTLFGKNDYPKVELLPEIKYLLDKND